MTIRMRNRTLVAAALCGAALCTGTLTAQAATYNLTGDWSDLANPNGAWTYLRAGSPFAGTVANWSGFGTAWADSADFGIGFTPMLLKYDGSGSEAIDAVAGDIVTHTNTGDSNSGAGEVSIRFTNPQAGSATVSGIVWDAHLSVVRNEDWKVFVNGVLAASGTVLGDGSEGRANADQFLLSALTLDSGDTVELLLVRAPGHTGGVLGLDLTVDVTPVPLPAALPLMLSALAGGLGVARRRRRTPAG